MLPVKLPEVDLVVAVELLVFADESGIQESARYCIVSGYIGSPRHWEDFEHEWLAVLQQFGVSDFHAKQFFARDQNGERVGPYRGWTNRRAADYLTGLLSAVGGKRLTPVGGAVDVAAFNALSHGERRFLTGGLFNEHKKWLTHGAPSKPYYLAMQHLLVEAVESCKTPEARVHFVFDRQNVLQARAVETFEEISTGWKPAVRGRTAALGMIAFESRLQEEGLQAADLHPHAWYSYFVRGNALSAERRLAIDAVTSQRKGTRPGMRYFDAAALERTLSRIPDELRSWLRGESA